MKERINNYLEHVKVFNSDNHYKGEYFILKQFYLFLTKHANTEVINKTVMFDYISYLKKLKNSNYTINKKINCVNRLLKFHDLEVIKIPKLRFQHHEIKVLESTEIIKILNVLAFHPRWNSEYYDILDKAILYFLIDTGCRVTESCKISKKNLNIKEGHCLITNTKNYNDKKVYFTDITAYYLEQLIDLNDSEYLFFHLKTKKPIDRYYVRHLIDYINKLSGINFHVHTLRHSFATEMLSKGCPITSVQK